MNAKISINRQIILPSLWIEGAVCLFGKSYLQKPTAVFNDVDYDEQLARQLSCSIIELPHQLQNLHSDVIDLPQPFAHLLSQQGLSLADAFMCLLVAELENNYWLNLAIQELQGVYDQTYPKLHFVCDVINYLFDKNTLPSDIHQHPLAQLGLLNVKINGPLALSSLSINHIYWQYLLNPVLAYQQVSVLVVDDKKINLLSFSDKEKYHNLHIHSVHKTEEQKAFVSELSMQMRLKSVNCLHLYANYYSGLSFGFSVAEMLNRQAVVIRNTKADNFSELLFLAQAYHWFIIVDAEQFVGGMHESDCPILVLHREKYLINHAVTQQDRDSVYQLEQHSFDERVAAWCQWVNIHLAKQLSSKWLVDASQVQSLMAVSGLAAERLNDNAEKTIYNARLKTAPESLQDLAFHLPYSIQPESVVFNAKVEQDLQRLIDRCLHRESIFTGLGNSLAANQKTGVKALFSGESGTGKTLAASYIASQLGIPVYRMDLGSILNKYVGETEKNIHKLMEQAAADDFIILIDEADALFGKRSDAESGGERFANMLTNYLLSRIEQHQGIVLMTTNGLGRIDSAFMRRLDMIIEFQSPELEERARIWQSHLGDRSPGEQYCRQLASFCDLTGGYIRNAVLTAASEIPFNDQTVLPYGILLKTIAQEYRKSGKPLPPKLTNQLALHAV